MARPFALYHHSDAVGGSGSAPIGRQVAGRGLFEALVRHMTQDTFIGATDGLGQETHFREFLGALGWDGKVQHHDLNAQNGPKGVGALMLPGPSLAPFAAARARFGKGANYALCGVTHTISTQAMVQELYALLRAELRAGDAIICTSQAVRRVVEAQFENAFECGWSTPDRAPDLPVIPLGIDVQSFAPDPENRRIWRARLGLLADDVLILSLSRLSTFEKMHPAPLLIAVGHAQSHTKARLHLAMCGWFPDHQEEAAHRDMARAFAPDIDVTFPDGREPEVKAGLLHAADIFALPIDNIQETFGIAPLEAMAAGLPVVASDWNGLSESVLHNQTGFLAPTLLADPSTATTLGPDYDAGKMGYLQFLGSVQQRTAIDVRAFAEALRLLADDPSRRNAMGIAGRRRAANAYDWSVIVPQLESLWAEQAERAVLGANRPLMVSKQMPPYPNPLDMYREYASHRLSVDDTIESLGPVSGDDLLHLIRLTGATLKGFMPVSPNLILAANHAIFQSDPIRLGDLAEALGVPWSEVEAAVIWLIKFNLVSCATLGPPQ